MCTALQVGMGSIARIKQWKKDAELRKIIAILAWKKKSKYDFFFPHLPVL